MAILLKNNATSKLAAAIDTDDTTLVVESGHGARFPLPTNGDYFLATLAQVTDGREVAWEIVKVTARVGDTLTVVRAQEGTTALEWPVEAIIEHRLTSGSIVSLLPERNLDGGSATSVYLVSQVVNGGSANNG